MKKRKRESKGSMWGLTKITVLLGVIMLYMILLSFHVGFQEINVRDSAICEAQNIAGVIDHVGSSCCEVSYNTPEQLSGQVYRIDVIKRRVKIEINGGEVKESASFLSEIESNFSCIGGQTLKIKKYSRGVEVSLKDGM